MQNNNYARLFGMVLAGQAAIEAYETDNDTVVVGIVFADGSKMELGLPLMDRNSPTEQGMVLVYDNSLEVFAAPSITDDVLLIPRGCRTIDPLGGTGTDGD